MVGWYPLDGDADHTNEMDTKDDETTKAVASPVQTPCPDTGSLDLPPHLNIALLPSIFNV
jgi:hypothetical protein